MWKSLGESSFYSIDSTLCEFKAWTRKGKYEQRNKALRQETDFALLIHDGHSTGTINELLLCKKMKIKYKYIKLDILPEDSMQGITEEDIEFEEEEELWRTRQV